jgi:hypothetical protein
MMMMSMVRLMATKTAVVGSDEENKNDKNCDDGYGEGNESGEGKEENDDGDGESNGNDGLFCPWQRRKVVGG